MVFRIGLNNVLYRFLALTAAITVLGLLARVVMGEFIAGTLIDPRTEVGPEILASATEYLPRSGRLYARRAEVEMSGLGGNLEGAEGHATRAVELSPNNYNYRLLLASIKEARGDLAGAERSIEAALALAPSYTNARWKMGNLQLRMAKLPEAIEQFRFVASGDATLVPAMLDLIWRYSNQDVASLKSVIIGNPQSQLSLALFLANQSRIPEAMDILSNVDKAIAVKSPDASPLIDALLKSGHPKAAFALWEKIVGTNSDTPAEQALWNGGFELEVLSGQPVQFDWHLTDSSYARVRIDNKTAHSGRRSLLIDFTGKDTTRLADEVKLLVVLEPGVNYRMECYVKTQQLQTPEGPRVAVSDKSGKLVGASQILPSGTNDWTLTAFNFTSPGSANDDAAALTISVRREPRFVYDDPTKGSIWLDDFAISRTNSR